MHYVADSVIEPHGPEEVRREVAAFFERGSRSHF
jgi:hypothetical protein